MVNGSSHCVSFRIPIKGFESGVVGEDVGGHDEVSFRIPIKGFER